MSAKMSNAFKIIALSAGMSENSTTTRLAREIAQGAAAAVGADVEILELCPYARDVAEAMVTGFPSERLERILHSVETADALVVGTPVYNAMPSGLFVEFFDVLPEGALSGTPVAIAATGGTPRHSLVTEQIRPMLVYLHALVPTTAAYAATGEPLPCAGAFTLEALGGWFIDRIEGDPSNVIGLSLPVVRRALYHFGYDVHDFWNRRKAE